MRGWERLRLRPGPGRLLVVALCIALAPATAVADASNDDRANASLVAVPATLAADTVGATVEASEPMPCANVGATVWFAFVAPLDGFAKVGSSGSDFDTVLAAYEADSALALGCNDDAGSKQASLRFAVAAGRAYHVQAGGFQGEAGALALSLDVIDGACTSATNDCFANAVLAGVPYTATTNTSGAAIETGEPFCMPDEDATVWYAFTPASDMALQIDTIDSTFDTVLGVHTGHALDSFTTLACNDDAWGRQSRIFLDVLAGTTYYVQAGGYRGAIGDLRLNIRDACPHNDCFAKATIVDALPAQFTIDTATYGTQVGEPEDVCFTDALGGPRYILGGPSYLGRTAWFAITPTSTGPIALDTFGSDLDTVLVVYTGDRVTDLTEVACNDDVAEEGYSVGQPWSQLMFLAQAGTTYHIQAGGYWGESGNLVLNVANPGGLAPTGVASP